MLNAAAHDKTQTYGAWAAILSLTWVLVGQLGSQRFLFADGVAFFLQNSVEQTFSHWDFCRQNAHYLTQWPMVLGLKLGVRDMSTLATLNGLGLFLTPLFAYAMSFLFVPKQAQAVLGLIALAYLQQGLTASLNIISESHVASGCALALFCYAVFVPLEKQDFLRRYPMWRHACACAVAVAITRLHESLTVLGPIIFIVLTWRIKKACCLMRRAVWPVSFVLINTFIATCIGAWSIIFNPERSFVNAPIGWSFLRLFADPSSLLTSLCLGTACVSLVAGEGKKVPLRLFVALIVLGLALGVAPYFFDMFLAVWVHYPLCLLNVLTPSVVMVVIFWMARHQRYVLTPVCQTLCMFLLAWNFTWQSSVSLRYAQYRGVFIETLHEHPGRIKVGQTRLCKQPFVLSWVLPSESIINQTLNQDTVASIVVSDEPVAFEPFDPYRETTLPNLTAFKKDYVLKDTGPGNKMDDE